MNYPYYSPVPQGEFPLLASSLNYPDTNENGEADKVIYSENEVGIFAECGFNVLIKQSLSMGNDPSPNYVLINLNVFVEEGIKLIVGSKNLYSIIKNYKEIKESEALGGIFLKDEPTYSQLTENDKGEKELTLLEKYNNAHVNFPDNLLYINLFGDASENYDGHTLQEYVDIYNELYHPSFFSYDFYPILEECPLLTGTDAKHRTGWVKVRSEDFYKAFEIYSKKSKETGRPFWAFCESISYIKLNNYFRPIALESHLRFEAFSALAYGAKGIVYWTYATRKNSMEIDENGTIRKSAYLTALLDRSNKQTGVWYYAKRINEEIKVFKDIFLKTEFEDCVVTGEQYGSQMEMSCEGFGPFAAISSDNKEGLLISALKESDSVSYYMIVSKTPLDYQKATIYLKAGVKLTELTPLRTHKIEWLGDLIGFPKTQISASSFSRIFIPGGYRIFKYQR